MTMAVGGVLVFEAGRASRTHGCSSASARACTSSRATASACNRLTNPVWVDDEQFDLGWHVRRAALPAPGGPEELGRLLEAYPAVPLNPSNQGLAIGVLSYGGGVHLGLLADRDLDPPLTGLRAALEDAMNGRFAPPERG